MAADSVPFPSPARSVRLAGDVRRALIVQAVLALAAERGPGSVTTQAIAERIGVTQGALFRHFPDKEAVWLAVFGWMRTELGRVLDTAIAKGGTPLAQLERAFLAHVAFVAANPGVPRSMYYELQNAGASPVRRVVHAMVAGYRRRLVTLFDAARKHGELPAALDTRLAALAFIGAIQGLAIQAALAGGTRSISRDARALFALLVNGYAGCGAERPALEREGPTLPRRPPRGCARSS